MNQPITDKVTILKNALKEAGLAISERTRGFRVRLDSGDEVDIYALSSSPEHVRARIKIRENAALKRQELVESAQYVLSRHLDGLARISPFSVSRETGEVCIYNAVVEMPAPDDADEPIEIGADAIKVIPEESADVPAHREDPDAFQLDFDIEEDGNRLKTVSSLVEKALSQLESVDAKMLRQNLDMMGLKRSGTVRLALTRIFRSALDMEELESAIQNEALKIVTPEDRMALQMVKSLSDHGFLDAVVDLLWQAVFNDQY